jgi:ankyrin repeat protein
MLMNPLMFIILTYVDENTKSKQMLQAILKLNPKMNKGLCDTGLYPLLIAAKLKVEGLEIVQILVEHSQTLAADTKTKEEALDPNVSDATGNTALHYACINNDAKLVKFLVTELGADTTKVN